MGSLTIGSYGSALAVYPANFGFITWLSAARENSRRFFRRTKKTFHVIDLIRADHTS